MYTERGTDAADSRRLRRLEEAILENRREKKDLPDCPCWGNAPQWVDAELYAVLAGGADHASDAERIRVLEAAIRKHREDKRATPPCTCWMTATEKADAGLYAALEPSARQAPKDRISER